MAVLRSESRRALGEGHGWQCAGQGTHGEHDTRSFFSSVLHPVCNGRMTSGRLSTRFDVFLLNSGRRVSSYPAVMPGDVNTKIR
jgi:hypothetical protein